MVHISLSILIYNNNNIVKRNINTNCRLLIEL